MNIQELKNLMVEICCGDTSNRQKAIYAILQRFGFCCYLDEENSPLANIIVPSTEISDKKIVVTAHYDVVSRSLGYNDNTSGVVTLISMLTQLQNRNDVEFVLTSGEEFGGIGADNYIKNNCKNILCNCNFDVCGLPGSIYADNNIPCLNGYLDDCECGQFPFCDGHVFRESRIKSISFCSGPTANQMSFDKGISYIFSTTHNNKFDNNIDMISFEMIERVAQKGIEIINILKENKDKINEQI